MAYQITNITGAGHYHKKSRKKGTKARRVFINGRSIPPGNTVRLTDKAFDNQKTYLLRQEAEGNVLIKEIGHVPGTLKITKTVSEPVAVDTITVVTDVAPTPEPPTEVPAKAKDSVTDSPAAPTESEEVEVKKAAKPKPKRKPRKKKAKTETPE